MQIKRLHLSLAMRSFSTILSSIARINVWNIVVSPLFQTKSNIKMI